MKGEYEMTNWKKIFFVREEGGTIIRVGNRDKAKWERK